MTVSSSPCQALRFCLALTVCAALASAATPASAQSIAGRFVAQNQQGGTIVLILMQDAQGQLTGSLTAGNAAFKVEGMVDEEGVAVGAMSGEQTAVFFQAELDGARLVLTLIEPGPDNMPDYSRTRQIALMREANATGPVAPANPLARGQARAGGGKTSLLGQWSCQTAQGAAQLGFVSENQLTFNGESSAYQLVGNVVRVQGEWGPVDYQYQLNGDQLAVTGPDGSSMQCRRQAAAQPGAVGAGGTGMEARLQGRVCSFSSSPDGGMSTLYVLEFDGQGRFTWGNESSYSGDPGSAYGRNTGNVGTYRVTGMQVGAPIIFTYGNGQSTTGYVAHIYQGQITEVKVSDRHYGKTICQ